MADLSTKAIEEEIDGVMYKVWPLPFSVGRPALVRLLGVLSPILSGVFKAQSEAGQAAALFEALPAALTDADLAYFGKVFGDASQYRTASGDWAPLIEKIQAEHFADRYFAYFRWIALAARCNYAGFFAGIKSGASAGGLFQMMTPK